MCVCIIYYIENNYMFRRLVMAIFRLYITHSVSSYTKHIYGLLIWGREGVKCARDLVSALKVGWCGLHGGSMLLPSYQVYFLLDIIIMATDATYYCTLYIRL